MKVLNDLLEYENLKIYQDTEMFSFSLDSILLANFVKINKNIKQILDIGCGNGVIPIVLTKKTNANITGIEIQKEVFNLAIESVQYNNLDKQISILNKDICKYYKEMETDQYDVITCNPPFFKKVENSNLNNSIHKQIARHEIFLNLEDIAIISKKILKNNGILAMVHRPERLIEIISILKKNNLEPKRIQFVYPKMEKEANILLIEAVKNGKSGIKILPPIYVHNKNGDYREKIKKIFK